MNQSVEEQLKSLKEANHSLAEDVRDLQQSLATANAYLDAQTQKCRQLQAEKFDVEETSRTVQQTHAKKTSFLEDEIKHLKLETKPKDERLTNQMEQKREDDKLRERGRQEHRTELASLKQAEIRNTTHADELERLKIQSDSRAHELWLDLKNITQSLYKVEGECHEQLTKIAMLEGQMAIADKSATQYQQLTVQYESCQAKLTQATDKLKARERIMQILIPSSSDVKHGNWDMIIEGICHDDLHPVDLGPVSGPWAFSRAANFWKDRVATRAKRGFHSYALDVIAWSAEDGTAKYISDDLLTGLQDELLLYDVNESSFSGLLIMLLDALIKLAVKINRRDDQLTGWPLLMNISGLMCKSWTDPVAKSGLDRLAAKMEELDSHAAALAKHLYDVSVLGYPTSAENGWESIIFEEQNISLIGSTCRSRHIVVALFYASEDVFIVDDELTSYHPNSGHVIIRCLNDRSFALSLQNDPRKLDFVMHNIRISP